LLVKIIEKVVGKNIAMILRVPSSFPSYFTLFFPILLSFILTFPSVYPEPSSSAISNRGGANNRKDKLLNVFNIVRFPNDGCNTTESSYGVCYTASECSSLGGNSRGTCASGFGVCCSFSMTCGGTTSLNNTYLTSTDSDSSPCTYTICKASSDICQIRLGFSTFQIASPSTQQADNNPNGRTQCQTAQFSASSAGTPAPTICGTNTGYHMILEADDNCNTFSFTWSSSSTATRSWNIHAMQIPCTATWKPPDGCLQWFTGTTGTVYTYNYQGGSHLANQNYQNCIRSESGYCSISYTASTFEVSGTTAGLVGDSCTLDYVLIPGGAASAGSTPNYDRFCGAFLAYSPLTANSAVLTSKMPFQVGVIFDGTELDPAGASGTYTKSTGFQIAYTQVAC